LLNPIGDEGRVINPEDLKYYESLPDVLRNQSRYIAIGVDLAISEKDSADYTAIVAAEVVGNGKDARIYVLPGVINKRIGFKETAATIKTIVEHYSNKYLVKVFIEDVGYQRAQVEELKSLGIDAEGCSPGGLDKRSRLALLAPAMANGEILFSSKTERILIDQMIDFGVEKHDDCMDAFLTMARGVRSSTSKGPSIIMTNLTGRDFRLAVASSRGSMDWADLEDAQGKARNSRGSWNRLL
jgi:predicted phage terminase large subunit-like protein